MKLSSIKVDSALTEAGDWVGDIPEMEDLQVRVRGLQCASARTLRNKLIRSLPTKVRLDPAGLSLEAQDEIETKVLLDVVLLDWKNVDEGKFSRELAAKYLSDPDYVAFREAVMWAAMRVGREQAEARETDLGNSRKPSAGS